MDGMQLVEDVLNSNEQLEEVRRETESSPGRYFHYIGRRGVSKKERAETQMSFATGRSIDFV